MNKPKAIGTAAETAVVKYLRLNGWPSAERRALAGAFDLGDILTPGICWEVKGGHAAEVSHPGAVQEWQRQTDVERVNSRSDVGVLVCKRKASGAANAHDWYAWLRLSHLYELGGEVYGIANIDVWVRMTLREAVWLLRQGGYGTPLNEHSQ